MKSPKLPLKPKCEFTRFSLVEQWGWFNKIQRNLNRVNHHSIKATNQIEHWKKLTEFLLSLNAVVQSGWFIRNEHVWTRSVKVKRFYFSCDDVLFVNRACYFGKKIVFRGNKHIIYNLERRTYSIISQFLQNHECVIIIMFTIIIATSARRGNLLRRHF